MSEEMRFGMIIAYQSVKEEMDTIKAELHRKGFKSQKGFTVLEQFIEDRVNELNYDKENS